MMHRDPSRIALLRPPDVHPPLQDGSVPGRGVEVTSEEQCKGDRAGPGATQATRVTGAHLVFPGRCWHEPVAPDDGRRDVRSAGRVLRPGHPAFARGVLAAPATVLP